MYDMVRLLPSPPLAPIDGQTYYNPIDERVYTYHGGEWVITKEDKMRPHYKIKCTENRPSSAYGVWLRFEATKKHKNIEERNVGYFDFYTLDPSFAAQFEIDKEYYIDILPI